MVRRGIVWCFLFILNLSVSAQDNTPKYSNEFLNIGVDARAFGMGLSMSSHTDDISSGYFNPAGLTGLKSNHQLVLMHSAYFAGIANYDYGAFATRIGDSAALSISVIRFSVDDIADTRLLFDANGAVNYDNIQFFSASDYAFLMSYGRILPFWNGLKVGGSVKVIRRIVGQFATSWGFGLDIGIQKKWKSWQFGLVGKDISGTFNSWSINDEELADIYAQTGNELYTRSIEITLPRLILGASRQFELSDKFTLLSSLDLVATTDGKRNALVKTDYGSLDPMFGIEIGYAGLAFLRGGVSQFQEIKDFNRDKSWTFQPNVGIGVKLREVSIDYAFTDIGDQSAGLYSHVFSIKVDFNVEE
ncbi:MAG: hypothetical protein RIC35_06715 [Marinoscillum sp.]